MSDPQTTMPKQLRDQISNMIDIAGTKYIEMPGNCGAEKNQAVRQVKSDLRQFMSKTIDEVIAEDAGSSHAAPNAKLASESYDEKFDRMKKRAENEEFHFQNCLDDWHGNHHPDCALNKDHK